MILHIEDKQEFLEAIKQGKVLVDFFATWCGPCRMTAPNLEQLDKDPSFDVQIIKVDVDEAGDIAALFGIQAIPTLIYFEDGKQKNSYTGFMRVDQIIELCK